MAARALAANNLLSLERQVVSLFGNFVGVDNTDCLKLDVDGGTEEFTVGDTVTGGTSNATGVIYSIDGSTGVWDADTHTGAATLVLVSVVGSFQNNEDVTGAESGDADANGTGTADTLYLPVTTKGKGLTVTNDNTTAGTAGLYTIQLEDKWAGLLGFNASVMDATTPDDWEVVVVSEAVASSKTVVIQVFKGGVAAAVQADDKLFFELVLSNTQTLAGY